MRHINKNIRLSHSLTLALAFATCLSGKAEAASNFEDLRKCVEGVIVEKEIHLEKKS